MKGRPLSRQTSLTKRVYFIYQRVCKGALIKRIHQENYGNIFLVSKLDLIFLLSAVMELLISWNNVIALFQADKQFKGTMCY